MNYPFGEGASELVEQPTCFPHPALPRTREEAPDLIGPPLNAYHEHAGDGQLEERAPVLQALKRPPCRWDTDNFTAHPAIRPSLTQDKTHVQVGK